MTTIINTPPAVESSDSGLGIVFGVILAILIVVLFLVYGLPMIRNSNPPAANGGINVNVQLPTDNKTPAPNNP